MFGFVADPRRVDYWTSGKPVSLEELKELPIWNTFSEERKRKFEEAAARGPENLKKYKAQVAEYERKKREAGGCK